MMRSIASRQVRYSRGLSLNRWRKASVRFISDGAEQRRLANLGSTFEQLKELAPNMLLKTLPKDLASPQIALRICPTRFQQLNSYLPTTFTGQVSYYTTVKAIQVIVTLLVLSDRVRIHIHSMKIIAPEEDTIQRVCPGTTAIRMRWSTCQLGCHHLRNKSTFHSTSASRLGSHRMEELHAKPLALITAVISSFLKEREPKLEHVISGIFIFELNEENDQVLVHTIEDIDLVERTEEVGELRVC